jgi:death-on-curing protein
VRIKYPTLDEILATHDSVIISTGGFSGILSIGNLDFVIEKLRIPRRFERKISTLLFGIIVDHPFVDGNKRTAFVIAQPFGKRTDTILKFQKRIYGKKYIT